MRDTDSAQPLGEPLPGWRGAAAPARTVLQGRTCRLEPLDAALHGPELFSAFTSPSRSADWSYLPVGPFAEEREYLDWAERAARSEDPLHFTVRSVARGTAVGTLALMRHVPEHGVIEVGNVMFSPQLQRRRESTEAQYLLMRHVFEDLGYRRYEWKCDSLNAPSRATAERLGFSFEGIFRQALVVKGRNRDTAWFSILDREWPRVRAAFEAWLAPENFDASGAQLRSLAELRAAVQSPVHPAAQSPVRSAPQATPPSAPAERI